MPDREKVTKEFEHLLNAAKNNYQDFVDLTVDGGDEILAALKEQEEKIAMMRMIYGTDAKVVGEIIRCKDCKHGKPCNDVEINCEKDIGTFKTTVHEPDWFCADGERP